MTMAIKALIQPKLMLVLLMLGCSLSVAAVESELRLGGAVNRPPFEYVEQGQLKGINVEIAQAVFADLGQPVEIKLYSTRRLFNMMLNGSIDGSVIWNSRSNLKSKALASQVYYRSNYSFYSLRGRAVNVQSKQDLTAYSLGFIGVGDSPVPARKSIHFNDDVSMVKSLLAERVDVIVLEDAIAAHVLNGLGASGRLQRHYDVESVPVSFAFSRLGLEPVRAKNLLEAYNKSMLKLKKKGVIREIILKYSRVEYFSNYQ